MSSKQAWQQALIQAVTDPLELCRLLQLNPDSMQLSPSAAAQFSLKVPRGFVARMQKGNPNDPLLRQVLPITAEDRKISGYSLDPLHEANINPVPGLLHRYHGRVLLTLAGTCAINCRYCFRRHFPYTENNPGQHGWEKIFDYLKKEDSITEVILSGGDPLLLPDKTLHAFTEQLSAIPHVKRLRLHSRIPIVLPERITPEFLNWITTLSQTPVLMTHSNHPQEINSEVIAAMRPLKQAGILLLNQAVLLKGINDNTETLIALSESLFNAGIQPCYVHLLDKVQGAAHFDLELNKIRSLYRELTHRLPGYLVPKLVRTRSGEKSKITIG